AARRPGTCAMPELWVAGRHIQVPTGSNLLDVLLENGQALPYSCRAGSCQACMVRCTRGEPEDALPAALSAQQRADGWRLACQCRITTDLEVQLFDPARDAQAARVAACDWLSPSVLRLRLL